MKREKNSEDIDHLYKENFINYNLKPTKALEEKLKKLEIIFINSFPKRKKEGVYYTNKKIAEFMAKESIFSYISYNLIPESQNHPKIKNYKHINQLPSQMKKILHNDIENIKICDPAIGAGIFLIKSADVLLKIHLILNSKNKSIPEIKTNILSHIFGFDRLNYLIRRRRE